MALKGDVSEFSVEHVLQLLDLSGQTGTLDVRGTAAKASIEVTSGAVSNVRGSDDAETALGRALLLRDGTFTFKPGPTGERVIDAPLDELIARSRTKATKAVEIEAGVPDETVRFRLSDRAMSGTAFTVGPEELKVLMEVGGGRSVREIRKRTRTLKSRTVALLYGLLQKGLIERTESEAAVAVQAVGPAASASRRSRRRARTTAEVALTEPPRTAEAAIEVTPAPVPVDALPADLSARELGDELDARLAALAGSAGPAEAPAPDAERSGELVVVTPSVGPAAATPEGTEAAPEATVVFALHYMPATAQPPVEAPAPVAPKRRGLFDLILRRPSAEGAAQPEIDIPLPADLASLANALYAEHRRQAEAMSQLGSHAERAARSFEATLADRLSRIYELRAVGSRIPLRGDAIDVDAIRTGDVAPGRMLPYLALLVRDLRDEAARAFGTDDARATYEAVAGRVFGRQVASPTMILRHADLPPRGRLRRQDRTGQPFELRDRTYVIGRAASSDVVVPDEKVSSRHAQLVPDVLGFRLRDLGSRNGTHVNDERLAGDRLLHGGETIRVGDTAFVYERVVPGN